MLAYILRRLLLMIPTLLGIMLISFVIIQFAPGGPVERIIAQIQGTDVGATARFSGGGGDVAAGGGDGLVERADDRIGGAQQQLIESAGLLERDVVSDGQWVELTPEGRSRLREEYEQYRRVFEAAGSVELRGTVTSGMGEGRHYISLPGYMEQFESRLGYAPFAGTLNVDLSEASVRARAGESPMQSTPSLPNSESAPMRWKTTPCCEVPWKCSPWNTTMSTRSRGSNPR